MNNIKVIDADRVEIDGRVFVAENVNEKWVPDKDCWYFIPDVLDFKTPFLEEVWCGVERDLRMLKNNLVCRTKEEAIEKAKRMLKALEVEK